MEKTLSVRDEARLSESWQDFYINRHETRHLSAKEDAALLDFISRKAYLPCVEAWEQNAFPSSPPVKHTVNKEGSSKKRIVYSFEGDEGIFLKYIAWQLFRFDEHFCPNCYAFRRSYGARDAIRHIRRNKHIAECYCLKIDISNYFNSIDTETLLTKLSFIEEKDPPLYELFCKILRETKVLENGHVVKELHGAMAGTPISPFFANVYLRDLDDWFYRQGIPYFRYSDDILIFAESREALADLQTQVYKCVRALGLEINPDKIQIRAPGESWEFLGFSYHNGEIDLSENTLRKTKAKIRRKTKALRRWQRKKGLSPDKAAIGLIHTMNCKFFGSKDGSSSDDFSWARWFFPCLTTDLGLREVDAYMQKYIRYAVTGRHSKANYRIRYKTLKKWGYKSLVHAYYEGKNKGGYYGENCQLYH